MTPTSFPSRFLWGAATSAHQVEGNNTGSDVWAAENMTPPLLPERSGDACDSYHRWREDLDIVADLGLNAYRFGIEWARIEPEPGRISRAELAHYRRMIEGCTHRGVTPVVTLHHFTSPRWFAALGGWTDGTAVQHFRDYVRAVLPILDGVRWVCTINEPNVLAAMSGALHGGRPVEAPPSGIGDVDPRIADTLTAAHHAASEVLAALPGARTGWTVANQNAEPAPDLPRDDAAVAGWSTGREDRFIDAAAGDGFIGVQAYTRALIGPDGTARRPPAGRPRTLTGWEYYPGALEGAVRHTASRIDVPILVTENGIATADDTQRLAYLRGALAGLASTVADGIDVRGYLHWSLLDNYEWGSWTPTFGLVAVDRETFARTVKPSARSLGEAARRNMVPADGPEDEPPAPAPAGAA